MAITDEEWKKFLSATEEDNEEVETPGEDEAEEIEGDEEDDSDESDEQDGEEADEDDDSEEEDDSKKDKGEKKKPADADTYKPKLKQFFNEDGSLDAEKIEKAYIESGKQAVKLDTELKTAVERVGNLEKDYGALLEAIKAKPDIAKALFGDEGAKKLANSETPGQQGTQETNPLLQHIEAQMNNASKREYNEFVEAHPEAVTDPEKARLIGEFMKLHGRVYREQHSGEIPSMKESIESAYRYYGWELEIKNKEDVASAAKKAAATRSSGTAKRPATKKELSLGEEFFARKLGVKLKKK